ncbi:MAG: hypothetical protein E6G74_22755 [Alphaproteobacteria bacterium]|nr:MAG: hypothetical protein E6G74_22755 [Alphaproteobacteria bacterium]
MSETPSATLRSAPTPNGHGDPRLAHPVIVLCCFPSSHWFTSREHVIGLEPRGKGLLGVTLRYPYEVRKEDEYFDEIADEKIPKDMLELASHIVETKSGHFKPEKFEDHYEDALKEASEKEAVWSEDRSAKRACPGESDQSHGCATPKRGRGAWWRWARRRRAGCSGISSDAEESRTIERTQENRLAGD